MDINQLTALGTLSASDLFAVWSNANGDTRKVAASVLLAYIQAGITTNSFQTQYAAPNATGFVVQVVPLTPGQNVWLLMTPLAGYASGAISLPPVAQCAQGQEVLCNSTQLVTTLVVSGNGAAVNGAPTTLTANGFFRLRFDLPSQSWYRI